MSSIRSRWAALLASPMACSVGLLVLLAAFCLAATWGRRYPTLVRCSHLAWQVAQSRPAERRRLDIYYETYPVLLWIRAFAPPDAVVLLPPRRFISQKFGHHIPLLANATSVYSFIYPRLPVHHGDPSPWKDRATHLLVWEHWGLDLVQPNAVPTEENRFGLHPWPHPAGGVPARAMPSQPSREGPSW